MLKCEETETVNRDRGNLEGGGVDNGEKGSSYITNSNPELDRSSTDHGDDTSQTTAYFGSDMTQ